MCDEGEIMDITVYVIQQGKNLYIDSGSYALFPTTTNDILHAKFHTDYATATKIAKKSGGTIITLRITDEGHSEADMLRAANIQLQRERDEALSELNKYRSANGG